MLLHWAVYKRSFYSYALYLRYALYVFFYLSNIFCRNEIDGIGGPRIPPTWSKPPLSLMQQNINKMGPLSFFQDCENIADKHLRVRSERRGSGQDSGMHHLPLQSNCSKSPYTHPANLHPSLLPTATECSSASLTISCS